MKTFSIFSALVFTVLFLSYCKVSSASQKPPIDPFAKERAMYVSQVNASIMGKEQMDVDSVFTNLKVLSGFPAENLVFAMDKWAQGLGVSCTHCHNTSNWASDIKPQKDIARQMVNLGEMVNGELRKIEGLKSERPIVNCITCHRGQTKPALRMR